jgi:hypothetical protein
VNHAQFARKGLKGGAENRLKSPIFCQEANFRDIFEKMLTRKRRESPYFITLLGGTIEVVLFIVCL